MFGVADYGAFVAAILLFLLIPGPGNLALIASTGQGGVRAGMTTCSGVIVADQAMMWLAMAGMATLLEAHPTAFLALQWLGAAYLAWLGIKMWLARFSAPQELQMQSRNYFRQGMLITLLNPQGIVFYMAFFPLFIDPETHQGVITFSVMAASVAVVNFLYSLTLVLLTHFLANRLRASPRVVQALEKMAGTCLIGFGIKLAISR